MAKCLCALVDSTGRVVLERSGYVKRYFDAQGAPCTPAHVAPEQTRPYSGDFIEVEDKVRWVGDVSYKLYLCPQCCSLAGKRNQAAQDAAAYQVAA
jgi:hypothetical protein